MIGNVSPERKLGCEDDAANAGDVTGAEREQDDVLEAFEEKGYVFRRMTSPCKPSPEEIDLHNLSHVPFRNWCGHCIKGRGRETVHKRSSHCDRRVPEVSFDYAFPGSQGSDTTLKILVGRVRQANMTLSMVVPSKGFHEFTKI